MCKCIERNAKKNEDGRRTGPFKRSKTNYKINDVTNSASAELCRPGNKCFYRFVMSVPKDLKVTVSYLSQIKSNLPTSLSYLLTNLPTNLTD